MGVESSNYLWAELIRDVCMSAFLKLPINLRITGLQGNIDKDMWVH